MRTSIFTVVKELSTHPLGIQYAWDHTIVDEEKYVAAKQISQWLMHHENASIGNSVLFEQRGLDGVCPIRIYCRPIAMELTIEQQWDLYEFFFEPIIIKVPRYLSEHAKEKISPQWEVVSNIYKNVRN
jgi:hypothetical protein